MKTMAEVSIFFFFFFLHLGIPGRSSLPLPVNTAIRTFSPCSNSSSSLFLLFPTHYPPPPFSSLEDQPMTNLMLIVCCIGSDSVNKGFTFSFHLFNVLQSSLFNFSYFCFVCLFVLSYSDTPTSLSSSGPGLYTVETKRALF